MKAEEKAKESIYGKSLLAACILWIVAAFLPESILSRQYFMLLSALVALVLAPALTGFLAVVCVLVCQLFPKKRVFFVSAGEICGQFAVSIDRVLGIIPGNPFSFGKVGHMRNLALVLSERSRFAEAKELLLECIELTEKDYGKDALALTQYLMVLVGAQRGLGEFEQSIKTADRLTALAEKHESAAPDVAAALADLCVSYSRKGKIKEAEMIGEQALELLFKYSQEEMPWGREAVLAAAMNNLGCVYDDACKYERSAELYRRALNLKTKCMPEGHVSIGAAHCNVGFALLVQEKYEEAREHLVKALSIVEAAGEKDGRIWAIAIDNMGDACRGLGEIAEAEIYLLDAVRLKEKLLPPNDPSLADAYLNLGKLYRDKGEVEESDRQFKKALSIFELQMGEDHPQVARVLAEYSKLLRCSGRSEELALVEQRIERIRGA